MSTVQGDTPTSEVLDRAADLLRDGRWITGAGWPGAEPRSEDELCLEGGIMAALGIRYDTDLNDGGLTDGLYACPAYEAVREYLAEARDFKEKRLFRWNDAYAKNKRDVITVLRAAARREKKKELASE